MFRDITNNHIGNTTINIAASPVSKIKRENDIEDGEIKKEFDILSQSVDLNIT